MNAVFSGSADLNAYLAVSSDLNAYLACSTDMNADVSDLIGYPLYLLTLLILIEALSELVSKMKYFSWGFIFLILEFEVCRMYGLKMRATTKRSLVSQYFYRRHFRGQKNNF